MCEQNAGWPGLCFYNIRGQVTTDGALIPALHHGKLLWFVSPICRCFLLLSPGGVPEPLLVRILLSPNTRRHLWAFSDQNWLGLLIGSIPRASPGQSVCPITKGYPWLSPDQNWPCPGVGCLPQSPLVRILLSPITRWHLWASPDQNWPTQLLGSQSLSWSEFCLPFH